MSDHDLHDTTIPAFLERLGAGDATPGGGAAAAVTGATGAALVRMLCNLTIGRPRYADHEKLLRAVAEQAAEEQEMLLRLAAEDADAYGAVIAAQQMPRETETEQAARERAVEDALRGACEVPLKVMERCLEVIGLARNAVMRGNKNAASDGAVGAQLAQAALKAAAYNVRINLAGLTDADYVAATNTRLDEMEYMGTNVANALDSFVRDLWKPDASPLPGG